MSCTKINHSYYATAVKTWVTAQSTDNEFRRSVNLDLILRKRNMTEVLYVVNTVKNNQAYIVTRSGDDDTVRSHKSVV